ncbi:MAG TPA: DUF6524 family protein [Casimicrobiaceae bacterium]|nr:DUF6524 family protein [Casimicrobiaceae bacterium]
MLGGMLVRILFAVILVLATWNPAGVSYVQWALIDTSSFDATKALVGVVLLAAWILCVRATWVSLGLMGVVLAAVVIGVFVWWLVSVGIVATDQRTFAWVVLVAVGVVLGIGMGWSLLRQKATGQVETD